MIIMIELYTLELNVRTLKWEEKNHSLYVNPSHIVWMGEQELSIKLSTGEKYYCRLHATWEYIRTIVYNYSK